MTSTPHTQHECVLRALLTLGVAPALYLGGLTFGWTALALEGLGLALSLLDRRVFIIFGAKTSLFREEILQECVQPGLSRAPN